MVHKRENARKILFDFLKNRKYNYNERVAGERKSSFPAARFLCHRIRVSKDTLTFIDFCLYLENLTRIDFRIGYLENLQNANLVFFILIMLSLFGRHNEPSYFHNPIAF